MNVFLCIQSAVYLDPNAYWWRNQAGFHCWGIKFATSLVFAHWFHWCASILLSAAHFADESCLLYGICSCCQQGYSGRQNNDCYLRKDSGAVFRSCFFSFDSVNTFLYGGTACPIFSVRPKHSWVCCQSAWSQITHAGKRVSCLVWITMTIFTWCPFTRIQYGCYYS